MKIIITGGRGMLGRTLGAMWREHEVICADLPELDITQAAATDAFLRAHAPQAVIHCAAMTAVDACEAHQLAAFRVNAAGSANVAAACHRQGIRLIAISTDYVFAGDLDRPYHEFDLPAPRTVYGQSKFAGEEWIRRHCPNHVIARISWLYGPGGPSFVHTMLQLADGSRPLLKVVHDQVGNPTSTAAVARGLNALLAVPELVGTYHLTCEGEGSWYDLAMEIFRRRGLTQAVAPCRTDEYPRPAPRPANSRLEKRMLALQGLPPMPDWRDALAEFLAGEV